MSVAYILWSALFDHEQHVILLSATRDQAVGHLKSLIHELETNQMLRDDFPEICTGPRPKPWRDNHIVLPNGVAIRALGSGQGLRGTKHRQHRPSLIIADDLEEQEQAESPDQRVKTREWFERVVLKVGDENTNVIVVGTILHYDSLLARLTSDEPGKGAAWASRLYRAVESFADRPDWWELWDQVRNSERTINDGTTGPKAAQRMYEQCKGNLLLGTKVLWPERESYLDLMKMRSDEGRNSFQAEKQNDPLDPDECLLREGEIRYWEDEFRDVDELLQALGSNVEFYGACDPSLGKSTKRGDYTAIITIAKNCKTGVCYVIGADLARIRPGDTIQRILTLAKKHRYYDFAFETNQFQDVLADQLEQAIRANGVKLYIKRVQHASHKQTRIQSLQPLISQGTVRFSRRHQLLLEQLRHYPIGAHDDGPDALEMALSLAVRGRSRVGRVQI